MNRDQIKELLPHREPMLLLDEMDIDENEVAYGSYTIRGDEFFLKGHFPNNPVVPGVIICEIMAQSCSILLGDAIRGKTPYYTGIDKVRFKQKVYPGDKVEIKAIVTRQKQMFYFTKCEVTVGGKLAAQGELSFAIL
ncbi:3-hydroxyacyl-ACP dehydratase FabZ [Christensenellaceae bacterium OttesenSCG-928-M15]|nr:3-hydroxyacyl-ACP dehydratase FabZ [Christensenellaceae bacterium OttesenSCG-928-M15]